jgi:hypothetical protein
MYLIEVIVHRDPTPLRMERIFSEWFNVQAIMISAKGLNSHLLDIHVVRFYIIKYARDMCM